MARAKEFDVDEALDRAIELFWAQGYEATSLNDLLNHMEIGRQSLYDTFGDKHELFLAALDRYRAKMVALFLGPLEADDASLRTIRQYFEGSLKAATSQNPRRGCLIVNSAMELAPHDGDVAKKCGASLKRVESAFLNALEGAAKHGELPRNRDLRALARHLTTFGQGMAVMAKSGASKSTLRDAIETELAVIGA